MFFFSYPNQDFSFSFYTPKVQITLMIPNNSNRVKLQQITLILFNQYVDPKQILSKVKWEDVTNNNNSSNSNNNIPLKLVSEEEITTGLSETLHWDKEIATQFGRKKVLDYDPIDPSYRTWVAFKPESRLKSDSSIKCTLSPVSNYLG